MTGGRLDNRQWFAKLSAAALPGAGIAFGVMGVTGVLARASASPMAASAQLLMWLAVYVWVSLLCGCFLFRSGRWAWAFLMAANVPLWAGFFLLRGMMS